MEKNSGSFLRPKILLIDDDKLLLGFFSGLAADHDFLPLTATDGPSGLATAKQEHPDLILLDVMLPGPDGFEVCRQLRAVPEMKDTPIIIMTAREDPALTVKGFKAGATRAILKPFDPDRLMNTIRTGLALKPNPPAS